MASPEKLTTDIELPNRSGRMDPRLNTPWYGDARRRAAARKKPVTTRREGGVGDLVRRAYAGWKTFSGGGR